MTTRYYNNDGQQLTMSDLDIWTKITLDLGKEAAKTKSPEDAFNLGVFVSQTELFFKVKQELERGIVTAYNEHMIQIAYSNEMKWFGKMFTMPVIESMIKEWKTTNYPITLTDTQ